MGNSCSRKKETLFRDAKYHKYATIGKRRVKEGECCSIWDRRGRVRNVIGPKLVRIFLSDVRFLDRFVADHSSYLEIVFRTGAKSHIRGPAAIFLDPVLHESIRVRPALSLNAFEAVVVYRELDLDNDGILSRNELVGAMDSLHFSKRPDARAFEKLLERIDADADGQISVADFRRLMREMQMRVSDEGE